MATDTQVFGGKPLETQFCPKFVEVQIIMGLAAARMVPFAEAATEYHAPLGALFDTQVVPEFEEVKIEPIGGPSDPTTNLVPSAEEATDQA
jgi:hypothetical protein